MTFLGSSVTSVDMQRGDVRWTVRDGVKALLLVAITAIASRDDVANFIIFVYLRLFETVSYGWGRDGGMRLRGRK